MEIQFKLSEQFSKTLEMIPPAHRKVIEGHLEAVKENTDQGEIQRSGNGGDLGRLQVSFMENMGGEATVELKYRIFFEWLDESKGVVSLDSLVSLNFDWEELYGKDREARMAAQVRLLAKQLREERKRHGEQVLRLQEEIDRHRKWEDPSLTDWSGELEEILRQSRTEQVAYDFKQGFHELKPDGRFNETLFRKVVRTLSAIANLGPFSVGYVIVGIADRPSDARRFELIYPEETTLDFDDFKITGIDAEVRHHYKSYDDYFSRIGQKLNAIQEVDTDFRKSLGQNLRLLRYKSKTLLVFRVKGTERPVFYDDRIFIRVGPSTMEAKPRDLFEVFRKF